MYHLLFQNLIHYFITTAVLEFEKIKSDLDLRVIHVIFLL